MFAGDPEIQEWQADLGYRLRRAVEAVYAEHPDEVACVEALVRQIQATKPATMTSGPTTVQLGVEGSFLHGQRSQVRFAIGGVQRPQRELADLLVLGLYVVDGALRSLRACFIQAKRSSPPTIRSGARFGIDEHQLALLRSFPEFEGVVGVYKGLKCKLRNRSGMLGAYGLLSAPGEFTVVSARLLGQILGGRKSFTEKELTPAIVAEAASYRSHPLHQDERWLPWNFDPHHCPNCRAIWEHWARFPWPYFRHRHHHAALGQHGVGGHEGGGSVLSCLSLDEFVDAWSSLRLGEPWWTGVKTQTSREILAAVLAAVSRVAKAAGGLRDTVNLMQGAARGDDSPVEVATEGPGDGLAVLAASLQVTGHEQG